MSAIREQAIEAAVRAIDENLIEPNARWLAEPIVDAILPLLQPELQAEGDPRRRRCWVVEPEHLGEGPALAVWDGSPTTDELLHGARMRGWVVRGPYVEPGRVTDEMVERAASELALIDEYDPNAVTPKGWDVIRDGYRDKARRVLEAALSPEAPEEDR